MRADVEPVHLFLGNHPETMAMALPMLHLLRQHPGLVVVCWSVIGRLFFDHLGKTIHIPTKHYTGHAFHRHLLERLTATSGSQAINAVDAMTEALKSGHDVFVAPAGAPPDLGKERPWHTGAARALQAATVDGVDIQPMGVYFHSTTLPPTHFPIPVSKEVIYHSDPQELTSTLARIYWLAVEEQGQPRLRDLLLRPFALRL